MSDDLTGLTSVEARRRLATYGPNEPVRHHRLSAIAQLVRLFANPLVIILLVASVISASLGQRVDALIIVTIVLVSISINFWQSYQSQQAADRLRASVTPTATVLRDGRWQEVPLHAVVPGDVFRLSAGDLVREIRFQRSSTMALVDVSGTSRRTANVCDLRTTLTLKLPFSDCEAVEQKRGSARRSIRAFHGRRSCSEATPCFLRNEASRHGHEARKQSPEFSRRRAGQRTVRYVCRVPAHFVPIAESCETLRHFVESNRCTDGEIKRMKWDADWV